MGRMFLMYVEYLGVFHGIWRLVAQIGGCVSVRAIVLLLAVNAEFSANICLGVQDGDCPFSLGHRDRVVTIDVSRDGETVVSVSADGVLITWSTRYGNVLWFRESGVQTATILPNDNRVVAIEQTCGDGFQVVEYELETGVTLATRAISSRRFDCVAISRDGKRVVAALVRKQQEVCVPIRMWDLSSGRLVWSYESRRTRATAIGFDRDGHSILVGFADGLCMVLDTIHKVPPHLLSGHTTAIHSVAMSSDRQWAIAGSYQGSILWSLLDHHVDYENEFDGQGQGVVAFASHGSRWLSSAGKRDIDFFRSPSSGTRDSRLQAAVGASFAKFLDCSGDVVLGGIGGGVARWDMRNHKLLWKLGQNVGVPRSVAFCGRGSQILVAYSGNVGVVMRIANQRVNAVLTNDTGKANTLMIAAASPGGRFLATGHGLGDFQGGFLESIQLWDAHTYGRLATFHTGMGASEMGTVEFTSDGQKLLIGGDVWDVVRRKRMWRFQKTHSQCLVSSGHVTRDDHHVLLGGMRLVRPFGHCAFLARCDIDTGKVVSYREIASSASQGGSFDGFALREDGKEIIARVPGGWAILDGITFEVTRHIRLPSDARVANISYYGTKGNVLLWQSNGTLVLFDLGSGDEIRRFVGHNAAITCVACCPDRDEVVSGSYDKKVILWNAKTGERRAVFAPELSVR